MRLHDFTTLSFDCYGTLIDWETGILDALAPLLDAMGTPPTREAALAAFARYEAVQQRATPTKPYRDILAIVYKRLAEAWERPADWDACRTFGASVGRWPAFPDSAEALAYLKRHYKLVVLSNVDNASFAASNARLGVAFDAIFTAEETGAYKPDAAGFHYMLDRLGERGIAGDQMLHTAQSLFHDHMTAHRLGLARCWIDRRQSGEPIPPSVPQPQFVFPTLEAFAEAHREETA